MASAVPVSFPLPVTVEAPRELKVRIPVALHLKLHTAKILHRQSMSETVGAALAEYFRNGNA